MTRILRTVTLLAAIVCLAACSGGEVSTIQLATTVPATTSAPATTTTVATTVASSTTSLPTTTTIPKAHIRIEVAVYDAWFDTYGAWTDYCLTRAEFNGVDFAWVGKDRNVLLTDPSDDEILAVALLSAGTVEVDEQGYQFCMFRGTFQNVPLDRSRYAYTLEGDHWGGVVTVEASELEDRTLGMVYYEPGEQQKRDEARDD